MGYVGGYYRMPLSQYLEFLPRFGVGLAGTELEIGTGGANEVFDSMDFFFRLGGGLRLYDFIWRDFFLELSPEFHFQPMAGAWLTTLGIYFRAGLIF
jgi:hypothetical protein